MNKSFLLYIIYILSLALSYISNAQVVVPFNPRYQATQKGNLTLVANSLLTCNGGAGCGSAQNENPPAGNSIDNNFTMVYIDIDGDASTFSSSSADLNLSTCSNITFAGLYWGGAINGSMPNYALRNTIKFGVPGAGAYTSVTADTMIDNTTGFNTYHCYKDVTTLVQAAGNGTYTVADVVLETGLTNIFGGWTMVVVFKNDFLSMRNITVFDGLSNVSSSSGPTNVTISGFLTPISGAVTFEIGAVSFDGDRSSINDSLLFNDGVGSLIPISNATNPAYDIFNSTISINATNVSTRNPNYLNTLGYDADIFIPNNASKNYLTNNQTSATLRLTTGGETYLTNVLTTSIDVYEPDERMVKTATDVNGGVTLPGDTILYTVTTTNIGSDPGLLNVVSDTLPFNADYVPGSIEIITGPNAGVKTDISGDDQAEYFSASGVVRVRLGTGANASTGGTIPETGANSTSFSFKVVATTDCDKLLCNNIVSNKAACTYKGNISGNTFTAISSPSLFDGFGCPMPGNIYTDMVISQSCSPAPDTSLTGCASLVFSSVPGIRPGYSYFDSGFASVVSANASGIYYGIKVITAGCNDTIEYSVTISQTPTAANAGADQSVCSTTATLAGNTPATGTGTWTLISGAGTITTPSSPTSTVTALGVGANVFQWTIANAPCASSSDQVTITGVAAPTTANAGADQSVCSTTATLAGNTPATGTGTWTLISGAGTITTPSSSTSTVTGLGVGANVFQWTIANAPCASSSDQVTITGVAAPTASNAGADQSVCSTTATLAGNSPTTGTGTWTLISGAGTITTPSSPTSTVTALGVGANVFHWTIANAPCASSSDQVTITGVAAPTTANAGADQSICSTTATLAGNSPTTGNGTWTLISGAGTITTPSSPTSTVTALGVGANVFHWTIANAPCASSSDQVTITGVAAPTTANAGADQSICSTTATLAGNSPTTGNGTWTLISGAGTITTPSSPTSTVTALGVGANVFQWTIANAPCASSSDQVTITGVAAPTTANAGANQSVCSTTATLAGNSPTTGNGTWTLISGAGTITTPSSPTSTVTALGVGANVFQWTIANAPCASSSDQVTITGVAAPTASNARADQSVCSTTVTLAGNTPATGTGTWTLISGAGTITTPFSATSTVTGLGVGTNIFVWTIINPPCPSSSDTVIITQTILSSVTTQTNVLCFGNNTGAIDLTTAGGTTPYTYAWSTADTTEDISGLVAGIYTVTITDASGCTISTTDTVTEPAATITSSTTQTNVLCFGNNTGAIDLTPSGGTMPYTYLWSTADTTEDITGLVAGIYTVTITDASGCTISTTDTITEPAATITSSTTQTNVLCFGNNTGAIDITTAGGTMPYTYLWSTADTTEDISGLAAGVYTVTITDASGCTISTTDTITEPAATVSSTTTQTNVLCFGSNTGAIDLTPAGGTTPYTYLWSTADTTEDITGLIAGIYTVNITDAGGCTISSTDTITEPAATVSSTTTQTNVLCFGNNSGAIDLTPAGGTTPYSYLWSTADTTEDISGLFAGIYSVTITDANNCTTSATVTITQPAATLSSTTTQVDVLCFSNNTGAIDLTPSGGTMPYSYLWSTADTTEDISGLVAGIYSVTITDANNCTTSATVTITQPAATLSSTTTQVDVLCFSNNTGAIDLTPSGGTMPYSYLWSTADTTEDISGLVAGIYTVTITDANNCTTIATVTITQPAATLSSSTTQTNVLCFGNNTGVIDLTPAGGTMPYSYVWSTADTTEDITGLVAGVYTVTITDANNCTTSATVTITQPVATLLLTSTQTNVLCFGNNTGAIDLTSSGGTTPYTYLWSTADTTEDITGLVVGIYTVTITDANNCTTSATVTITQPAATLLLTSTQTNVLCFGNNTGAIDLTSSGGTTPYTYLWSTADTTEDITGLVVGIYTVTITDANNCTTSATVTITQPAATLLLTTTQTNVLCFGNNTGAIDLTSSGGTTPYTYLWSTADTTEDITGLVVGIYTVTITDANNCTTSATVTITQPAATLSSSTTQTNVLCFGNSTGAIDLTSSGGTTPYSYVWSTADTTEDISGLVAGIYTVTITDASGCTISTTDTVTEPAATITSTTTQTNILCFGNNTGAIDLTPVGGTTPYTYAWSTSNTTEDLSGLVAGIYTVSITDASGCTYSTSVTVTQPGSDINISSVVTNAYCLGGNTGSIQLNVSGGTPAYNYLWNDNSISSGLNNLNSGIYSVTVTDTNNCVLSQSFTITDSSHATLVAGGPASFCKGGNVLLTTSGVNITTYQWFRNGQLISGVNNASYLAGDGGDYSVVLTTNCGTFSSDTFVVTVFDLPTINITASDYSCAQGAQLNASGGNDYLWSPVTGLNNSTINNPAAFPDVTTVYAVTATDVNGCTAEDSITIEVDCDSLFIPNGFSPDGDGTNDMWVILGLEKFPNNELKVFNRWGNAVYERNNYDNTWSGVTNKGPLDMFGHDLPSGTYYYILNVNDGKKPRTGFVVINR